MRISQGLIALTLVAALGACSGPRQPAGASDGKKLVTGGAAAAPKPAGSASGEDVAMFDAEGNPIDGISKGELDEAMRRQSEDEDGMVAGEGAPPAADTEAETEAENEEEA